MAIKAASSWAIKAVESNSDMKTLILLFTVLLLALSAPAQTNLTIGQLTNIVTIADTNFFIVGIGSGTNSARNVKFSDLIANLLSNGLATTWFVKQTNGTALNLTGTGWANFTGAVTNDSLQVVNNAAVGGALTLSGVTPSRLLSSSGSSVVTATVFGYDGTIPAIQGAGNLEANNLYSTNADFMLGSIVRPELTNAAITVTVTGRNSQVVQSSTNYTLIFSGTPTNGTRLELELQNTGATNITVTTPALISGPDNKASITSFNLSTNSITKLNLEFRGVWHYNSGSGPDRMIEQLYPLLQGTNHIVKFAGNRGYNLIATNDLYFLFVTNTPVSGQYASTFIKIQTGTTNRNFKIGDSSWSNQASVTPTNSLGSNRVYTLVFDCFNNGSSNVITYALTPNN